MRRGDSALLRRLEVQFRPRLSRSLPLAARPGPGPLGDHRKNDAPTDKYGNPMRIVSAIRSLK